MEATSINPTGEGTPLYAVYEVNSRLVPLVLTLHRSTTVYARAVGTNARLWGHNESCASHPDSSQHGLKGRAPITTTRSARGLPCVQAKAFRG